jgi:VRR-NUC domain
MGINKFIPQNIRKWMSPEDQKALGIPTDPEVRDKWFTGREKVMHQQFEDWLNRNDLDYVHPRMDKRTTVQKGVFDFLVWFGPKLAWVELKTDNGRLSEEQKEFLARQTVKHTPAFVAHSYEAAVKFIQDVFFSPSG